MDKAAIIAESLINSGALKFGRFILKSGVESPYYIDLAWLLSSPPDFNRVTKVITEEIYSIIVGRRIDKLATIELKGALILPHIAGNLKIPCIVVRKETKTYGLTGRIVGGEVRCGERFIFFDDVLTDGRSKIEGIKPIEEMGGIIDTIMVVVDREQGGKENLESMGYNVKAITSISNIVNSLLKMGKISSEDCEKIMKYVKLQRKSS
jgi:uridine monophosphate synthetase